MSKKIYNLNGQQVDELGDVIEVEYETIFDKKDTNKENKTGAKVGKRTIAIVLLCTALASSIIVCGSSNKQPEIIPTTTVSAESTENIGEFKYLYTDIGEKYIIDELSIGANLDNCDSCIVNGVYYSRVAEELYSVTVVKKYQETVEPIKSVIYVAPQGYVAIDERCYKIPEDFDTSLGYDNLENYTEYCTPEGYILIDNKAYQINKELFASLNIDAVEVELNEELPEGYIEINLHQSIKKIGIKKEDYEKAISLEEKTIYSVPTGYTLEGDQGIKTIYYKTEYLVTEEQYLNQEFSHLIDKKGEYFSHTINIVEARPMKELYDLLGIEYTEGKNLIK